MTVLDAFAFAVGWFVCCLGGVALAMLLWWLLVLVLREVVYHIVKEQRRVAGCVTYLRHRSEIDRVIAERYAADRDMARGIAKE